MSEKITKKTPHKSRKDKDDRKHSSSGHRHRDDSDKIPLHRR